jgi:hypothetical protein
MGYVGEVVFVDDEDTVLGNRPASTDPGCAMTAPVGAAKSIRTIAGTISFQLIEHMLRFISACSFLGLVR